MKTPFTDASTLFVSVDGRIFPVVSAEVARLLEIKLQALMNSQQAAWEVIGQVEWGQQPETWRRFARSWQEHWYVQAELPLTFPPQVVSTTNPPKDYKEALEYIARLESKLGQVERNLAASETLENELISKVQYLENEITQPRPFGAN